MRPLFLACCVLLLSACAAREPDSRRDWWDKSCTYGRYCEFRAGAPVEGFER